MSFCSFWRSRKKTKSADTESPAEEKEEVGVSSFPPPPEMDLPSDPYTSSDAHLWDELRRIDLLVRARTILWRHTVAAGKPQGFWGMPHVGDGEVNAYLRSPFTRPHHYNSEIMASLEHYWKFAADLAEAIKKCLVNESLKNKLRLCRLEKLFDLSRLDLDILLVCLLLEMDERYRRLYGYLQDDASRTQPTVELMMQILYPVLRHFAGLAGQSSTPEDGRKAFNSKISEIGRAAFDARANLLKYHLIRMNSDVEGHKSLPMSFVRMDDRIAGYLLGSDVVDNRLAGTVLSPEDLGGRDKLQGDHARVEQMEALAGWWNKLKGDHAQNSEKGLVLFLQGHYGSGRLAAAIKFCEETDTPYLAIDAGNILQSAGSWEQIVDICYREALLQDKAVYWSNCEVLLAEDLPANRWEYFVAAAENHPNLTFFSSEIPWNPSGHFQKNCFLRIDFPIPDYEVRRKFWNIRLQKADQFTLSEANRENLPRLLANGFQLTEGQIIDAVAAAERLAIQRDPQTSELTADDLYAGSRKQSGRRLIHLAQRVEPHTELTFRNLILPGPNKRQLEELRTRIRHYCQVFKGLGFERRLTLGKGLIALFTGSSGTGKTMAAELLACEHGRDLYKIDLSAVVSKYVGETEKKLSQVFAEAADSNAIIFFDEADALFGKRGEVREARDRWANIEINYLLQKVEEYAGVVILASNLRQNIDEAFMRRIHVIVEFPFPDDDARFRIWFGMFPEGIQGPPEKDIQAVAKRFRLSGGSIKNIVIDAAFRAVEDADNGKPKVTLRQVIAATAREYQKLGKPITKGEFGEKYYTWVEKDILAKA